MSRGDQFRVFFPSPADHKAAMRQANSLESRGLRRRAWRVRLNLDGPQPVATEIEETDDDE